jgi:hypothetical protein
MQRKRRVPLSYDTSANKNKIIRLVEESDPEAFPAEINRNTENEVIHVGRLSDLDYWKKQAGKLGRPWFIASAARTDDITGRLNRVFILYVKGGLAP